MACITRARESAQRASARAESAACVLLARMSHHPSGVVTRTPSSVTAFRELLLQRRDDPEFLVVGTFDADFRRGE
jgi:hypothetical protein